MTGLLIFLFSFENNCQLGHFLNVSEICFSWQWPFLAVINNPIKNCRENEMDFFYSESLF